MKIKKEFLKKLTNEAFDKWKKILLTENIQERLSSTEVWSIARDLGVEYNKFTKEQLLEGYYVELEHKKSVSNHREIVKIALDHLNEKPNYYQKLKQCVESK